MLYRLKSVFSFSLALLIFASFIPVSGLHASAADATGPVIPEESTFFATAMIDEGSTYNTASDGDLWPSAWSDDDNLYLANGDGDGWTSSNAFYDIAFNKITGGHPDTRNLTGERVNQNMGQVWSTETCSDGTPAYNRKPTGLTSRSGVLWLAVQDLNRCAAGVKFYEPMFNDAPNATILKSNDKGITWETSGTSPMFSNHQFTTIFFLDWGKDGVDNKPNSTMDDYIYAYGMDYNWRDSFSDTVQDPTKLFLARIQAGDNVQDLSKWQFWTGGLRGGTESWSNPGDISAKKPVLQDDRRLYSDVTANFPKDDIKDMTPLSQGSVTYNRALDRFIYLSWTEYTFEFYEAPAPWGPWKRFLSKDFGAYPWADGKNGGYTTVMPSKYISEDGKQMWFNANSFMGAVNNYNFSLRKLYVTPYDDSLTPANATSNTDNLAQTGASKTPIFGASVHQGKAFVFIDGDKTVAVDDWNGENKAQSYWGVTWSKPYNLNKVVYTSGNTFGDGGFFSSDLKVQVRQNFRWIDVTGSTVNPAYPGDGTAANKSYTFQFDNTWGDGFRIIGTAGGTAHFTSIAELEAYYADPGASGETFELTASKAVKVARVTGASTSGETIPNPNQTDVNWKLNATDLGIMWDATTADNPDEKKTMVLFGDSYDSGWGGSGGGGNPSGWRSNLLALSNDMKLADGLSFTSMISDPSRPDYAKEIIPSAHNTSGDGDFTAIPTAGVTVGNRHYVHYMQIKNWGANGRWNTNFSEIAYSDDNGQNWTKSGVKWGSTSKFAQAAYVKDGGYVYMFGTPAGRFGGAYLARVPETDILDSSQYEYWNGAGWTLNDETKAAIVVEAPVSELSVAYNSYYDKWIMVYLNEDRSSIVMRSSSDLTGGWSAETEIAKGSEYPDLYGGFIHPMTNNGSDLYFLMSQWVPYNVFLMHSTLKIGSPVRNLVADSSFENQNGTKISSPWVLESGNGGIDNTTFSRAGVNNVWLRNNVNGVWNGIKQTIAVTPNTDYRLKGFVRTSGNNTTSFFGVRNSDGTILKEVQFASYKEYSPKTVEFNSGSNAAITIYTGMFANNGDTWVQLDDYYLLPIDKTPPVISLKGNATVNVSIGETFTDPGATASDNADVELSHKIVVTGTVDTSTYGTYTLTYNVADSEMNAAVPVTRTVHVVNTNNNLKALTLSEGTLSPVFTPGMTEYTASVSNDVYHVSVKPLVADLSAHVTVNDIAVANEEYSSPISLNVGSNPIHIVVTAQDASTKEYIIRVTRATAVNSSAGNLVGDSSFELQPTNRISAPWTLESGNGGIDKGSFYRTGLNNVWLRNGAGWGAFNQTVSVTPNTVYRFKGYVKTSDTNNDGYFGVRNANGTVLSEVKFESLKDYSPLTVEFNSGSNTSVTIFTGMHANNGDTWIQGDDYELIPVDTTPPIITLTGDAQLNVPIGSAFTDPGATAMDNVDGDISDLIVVSGTVDTSKLGNYLLTYNVLDSAMNAAVSVTRNVYVENRTNANLRALMLSAGTLTPAFNANIMNYTASVSHAVYSIAVAPTVDDFTASVTVNGELVVSGDDSNPIHLQTGSNSIVVMVTAQDASTKQYVLNVTRELPEQSPNQEPAPSSTDTEAPSDIKPSGGSDFEMTTEQIDGKTVVTATLNAAKLNAILAKEGNKPVVYIIADSQADKVSVVLTGDLLKAMDDKQAQLDIRTSNGNYKLPASQVLKGQLMHVFGNQMNPAEVVVQVSIAKSSPAQLKLAQDTAEKGKFTIMAPPVEFSISASYNGKSVNIDRFSSYVTREIPMPSGVDSSQITTAVILEADGTVRPVPTTFVTVNGKQYVVVNSFTNSLYTLIRNSKTFTDVDQHWAKDAVNDLSARMVINGVDLTHFGPDAAVTRAELSAIIVRALGLANHGTEAEAVFTDVKSGDWYAGAVAQAKGYGLIQGYEDGTFQPLKTIARQEAMTMIDRAMRLAGVEATVKSSDVEPILSVFADSALVSSWAKQAIAQAVHSGVVNGSNDGLQPQNLMTRAETAVLVHRMLQTARLIASSNH